MSAEQLATSTELVDPSEPANIEAVVLARMIRDGETVFVGVNSPVPMAAALMARRTHAPNGTLITIAGGINPDPVEFTAATSDAVYARGSASVVNNLAFYDLVARRGIDLTFLGGAQVDRHGRVNSSFIGARERPKVRLPGGGGAAFILPLARRVAIWRAQHDRRIFVDECQFVTASGNLERVATPLCVFVRVDGQLVVESVHEGVDHGELQRRTGFPLQFDGVGATPTPTEQELEALNIADPKGIRFSEFRDRREDTTGRLT